jgi:hypothetical protein
MSDKFRRWFRRNREEIRQIRRLVIYPALVVASLLVFALTREDKAYDRNYFEHQGSGEYRSHYPEDQVSVMANRGGLRFADGSYSTPEPATLAMLGLGAGIAYAVRSLRGRSNARREETNGGPGRRR